LTSLLGFDFISLMTRKLRVQYVLAEARRRSKECRHLTILGTDPFTQLPEELQGSVLRRAQLLAIKNGWLKNIAKIGTGEFLSIGFAAVQAEVMHAQGASDNEVALAVADNLAYGIPGLVNAGADAAWDEANNIAKQIYNGPLSYTQFDPETSQYNGGNNLLISEQAVDAVLRRQNYGGGAATATAGSLLGW
jgi:hypothetical protein